MIGVPVRLFNLTRRNWISSLKTVKVRVVVEVGCYPTETRHVVKKDSRWEKTESTVFHSVSSRPSQAKVLTGGGDLREAQVDVPLSVSHSCV